MLEGRHIMVLCFECSVGTKQQIDELMRGGGYSNLSGLMAVAVSNQVLLQAHATQDGSVVFGDPDSASMPELRPDPEQQAAIGTTREQGVDLSKRWDNG